MRKQKTTQNKRFIIILALFVVAFLLIAIRLVLFSTFESEKLAKNENNPRLAIDETLTQRGNVYEKNGKLVAYTKKDEKGIYRRIFPFGEVDAPITGYNSFLYGKTGLEETYNSELIGYDPKEKQTEIQKLAQREKLGNDVFLTLNQEAQDKAYNSLKGFKGSIVIMDPYTGEVKAMVSNPTFNPNDIEEKWNELSKNQDGIFLNRATQGTYRPGSIMKIVSADLIRSSGINPIYNDRGYERVGNFDITNYGYYHYGQLDLKRAFRWSVNTYFVNKTMALGKQALENKTNKYMFNQKYDFDLKKSDVVIPYDELYDADLAMTSFGYGKTKVNPLHMAMVASTIANNGNMMKPILVKNVKDKNDTIIKEKKPEVLSEVTDVNTANYVKDLMFDMVKQGTQSSYMAKNWGVAGKTGTVENAKGLNDDWFIGFAPANNPKFAFAVVVEDQERTGIEVISPMLGPLIGDLLSIKDL